ncbi:MAG: accessory gene regulator B family protein [Firmicutes bacterium]|nr:accessory gene regulator B family protein [Bacillota bacterium]
MSSTIQSISRRLASEASYSGNVGRDAEVFAYAIKIALLNLTALGGIILIAWLLGTLKATLFLWTAAFSLRTFAGGRHSADPITCWFLTVAVFTVLGYAITIAGPLISEYVLLFIAFGLVFALFTVITNAPVTIASKQFTYEKRRKMKMLSVAVVVFWAIVALAPLQAVFDQPIMSLAITTGLVVQSISIMPLKGT